MNGSINPHLAIVARMPRHGLIGAECARLTGGRPDDDGVATCASVERIDRAAFVHHGLRVITAGPTFVALIDAVAECARSGLDADRFRIDVHDPADRSESTSSQLAVSLADVIPYYPDLGNPRHHFMAVARADGWVFGEVVRSSDAGYRRHDDKPWTTSSSLDSRFARALVNLVPDARSILDPCCGAGSIVLEAASLGVVAHAADWKPAMVGMTRANLERYGYDASVALADSRQLEQQVDAVVTDLPYGHALDSDDTVTRAIIEQAARLAPRGVFVAPHDISTWLDAAGYIDIEVSTVMKRKGFTRWVHEARSSHAS